MVLNWTACLALLSLSLALTAAQECGFDCQGAKEESLIHGSFASGSLQNLFTWRPIKLMKRSGILFYLYNRELGNMPEIFSFRKQKNDGEIFSAFQSNRTTKIIIHGWLAYVPSLITDRFKEAYLSTGDHNLIMVDWSGSGSLDEYPWAKSSTPLVANEVAMFIDALCNRYKLRPEDLHVIGHSLGAHIAGIAGHRITVGRIGRITGLDPASPLFNLRQPMSMLTRSSAEFVDVVHTCGSYLGMVTAVGHVDFYPNGGKPVQPGCGLDLTGSCSHRRAYGYFAESIMNPGGFVGTPCSSWLRYMTGTCPNEGEVPMGEHVPKSFRGSVYLTTNRKQPFALRRRVKDYLDINEEYFLNADLPKTMSSQL